MNDQSAPAQLASDEALEVLRRLMFDENATASARVTAAKALLDRDQPKNEEERKREAEEREMALASARGLLAEATAAKLACVHEPPALGESGAPEPADTGNGT